MAEEQEFTVIDKRRVSAEGAATPPSDVASEPAPPESEPAPSTTTGRGVSAEDVRAAAEAAASQAAEAAGDLPPVETSSALFVCIQLLQDVAWIKMGLTPNINGKIDRDLQQARVAIDALGDLVARLDPRVGDQERRDLQVRLSNLRINFVQQSQHG
jgi:hypothetical protein